MPMQFAFHGRHSPRRATESNSGRAARPRSHLFPTCSCSGAIGVGHAAPAWQHAAHWHAAPSQHRIGDTRAPLTCAARHRLNIRHRLGADAASGRIYRVANRLLSSALRKCFGWRRENDQVSRRAFGLRTSPWFGPNNGLSARAVVGRRGPSAGSGVCEHSNCENPRWLVNMHMHRSGHTVWGGTHGL